jgi:chaperone required for assembly of F1-ATPase
MGRSGGEQPKRAGKETILRPLPRRFYKNVSVEPVRSAEAGPRSERVERDPLFRILLDGRPARTPKKAELAVPALALAEAMASEWAQQGATIDPETMPLTRLVNAVLDNVRGREEEIRAKIVSYGASDLVCYRAGGPRELSYRQEEAWNPVLQWARDALEAPFVVTEGVMPVKQPAAATAALARALEPLDAFTLGALHAMTTLLGSALLALAHARGRISAQAAWAAAHVDEDWQISQWGPDAEADERRARRWRDMEAASRLLKLLSAVP